MFLKRFLNPLRLALLEVLLLLPAFAGGPQFIVRAPGGNMQNLIGQGATLVTTFTGSGAGLYVVSFPGLSQSAALSLLQSQAGVSAEVNANVLLPEASPTSQLRSASPLNSTNVSNLLSNLVTNMQAGSCATGTTGWSGYGCQPAGSVINLAQSRQFATGSGIVALLDTGIDPTHPVLAGSVVPGWDFIANTAGGYATLSAYQSTTSILDNWQSTTSILDNWQSTTSILDNNSILVLDQSTTSILDAFQSTTSILDIYQSTTSILDNQPPNDYGHGTMVAGLIHLVAPTAKLMSLRVFGNDGTANLSQVLEGIYYAVDHGVGVVNMSFSMTGFSQELANAVNYANSKGLILVAAAGNNGEDIMVYPAGLNQVIGVGSTNNQDIRSSFSNYGPVVDLAAPGEGLVTTYPNDQYALGWGTSFSTPLVTGGVALLLQMNPNLNGSRADSAITQCAPIGQQLGAGELDLFRACSYQASHGNGH
jgi:subtilisin family serine protease